jgi:hypothetical protein
MAIDEHYFISTPNRIGKSMFYELYSRVISGRYSSDTNWTSAQPKLEYLLYDIPPVVKDTELYADKEPSQVQILYKPKHGQLPLMKKQKEVKLSPILKALMKNVKTE